MLLAKTVKRALVDVTFPLQMMSSEGAPSLEFIPLMGTILHHFETMVETIVGRFYRIIPGFLADLAKHQHLAGVFLSKDEQGRNIPPKLDLAMVPIRVPLIDLSRQIEENPDSVVEADTWGVDTNADV